MPKRSEQDLERKKQQILDGALRAFAEKGFAETTNRDIAEAAGIASPGLIYHYFKDKAALVQAIIEQRATLLHVLADDSHFRDLSPKEALLRIGTAYLRMMEAPQMADFVRLLVGEAIRHPGMAHAFIEFGPRRGLELIARYLENLMLAGILRKVDPHAAARSLMGPLVMAKIAGALLPQPNAIAMDSDALLATHVDIFLRGLAPEEAP